MQDLQINDAQFVPPVIQGQVQQINVSAIPTEPPIGTPVVDQVVQPVATENNFKVAQTAAVQKIAEQVKPKTEDIVKSFMDSFKQEYQNDEALKQDMESEVKFIEGFSGLKDKDEVMLSLLNKSVEKIEQNKKRQEEIRKEKDEIQKISGYSEIIKKIEVMKKDRNYNEVWKVLEEKSPKLAFDTFKSLTNNFFNLSMNTKVVDVPNGHAVIAHNKTAISAVSCVKKNDNYF